MTNKKTTYDLPENIGGEIVPVLDFGSQYVQLIARRVREAGVFSVIVRPDISLEELQAMRPKGLILSGGPASVYEDGAPRCDPRLFELGAPILGICYGMQIACELLGAKVDSATAREYGRAKLTVTDRTDFFTGMPETTTVWMSHGDQVDTLPDDFVQLGNTPTCPFAAVRHKKQPFYGLQFHPEVTHTPQGTVILSNFLFNVCRCSGTWKMADFLEAQIKQIRQRVGDSQVVCGLSGGVERDRPGLPAGGPRQEAAALVPRDPTGRKRRHARLDRHPRRPQRPPREPVLPPAVFPARRQERSPAR